MNQLELVDLLRGMPVFGGLSNSTLMFLVGQSEEVFVPQGEFLFHEGDAAKSLFVIRDGTVEVEKDWEGVPVSLGQFGVGDCIGEMAIMDLESRSASVRAETDCRAMEVSRRALHLLYRQDLEQYTIIMMNMGREVSRRLRTATERLFAIDQSVA